MAHALRSASFAASLRGTSEFAGSVERLQVRTGAPVVARFAFGTNNVKQAARRAQKTPAQKKFPGAKTQFVNVSTGSVRQIRASGEDNQAVEGEEGKSQPASSKAITSSSETSTPSPFAAGKISSKIASQSSSKIASQSSSQRAENGKTSSSAPSTTAEASAARPAATKTASQPAPDSSTPSVFLKPPPTTSKPSFTVKPKSLIDDGSAGAFPTGKVSPFAADRLKSQMSSPPSQYNRTSSGRTMINSGKQVLEAFKQGEKDGKTTKFGQPIVPKNIFDDVRQTQEEKDADKFSFNLKPGDIFLVFSFLLIIGLMLGTAFIVWKVGAIHYNE